MKKVTTGTTLYLNIHSLIRITASNLTPTVNSSLNKFFKTFICDTALTVEDCDIVLSELKDKQAYSLLSDTKESLPFWITKHDDVWTIVFGHRGKPDIIIKLSEPIQLLYTPRKKCFGNLFNVLTHCLQIVLYRKQSLFFHGAVLSKNNQSLLLIGPPGIGKSIFVLSMLTDGWSYLSEDKFILRNETAYLFRPYIPLTDYHFELFPHLLNIPSLNKKVKHFSWFRKQLKYFSTKYLPTFLIKKIQRFYNPPFFTAVSTISPDTNIISTTKPNITVVLSPGFEFKFDKAAKEKILKEIKTIQWLAFPQFEQLWRSLYLHGYKENTVHFDHLIEKNLEHQQFYQVKIPYTTNQLSLYNNLKKCLQQVL